MHAERVQAVRLRHAIAAWVALHVPVDVRNRWASDMQLGERRLRLAVDDAACEGAPIHVEMLCFLPEPYRSGLIAALVEWAGAIERGEL